MARVRPRAAARAWVFCTAAVLVLLIAALVFANWSAQQKLVSQMERDPRALMSHERLLGWTTEVQQAGLEQELLRLARSADLKEAILAGKRAELLDQLEPPLNRLRKSPLHVTRITLYTPAGVARLRAHAPDSYGDDVLSQRAVIARAVGERRIVKGLEMESELLCLWAATPIYHQGRVVGILEVGSSMAPVVKAIRLVSGGEVGVLLGPEGRQTSESSNPQLFAAAASRLSAQGVGATRQVFVLEQKTYATTLLPLNDFSGRQAGWVAIVADATGITELLQRSNAVTFGISFLGLVLAAALLIVLTMKLDKFYADLERLYEEARQTHDLLHSISGNSTDVTVMTDLSGHVTYVSPRVRETLGYRPDELLGKPVATYYRHGLEEARSIMRRLQAEERIPNYETALRAGDGRWVSVNVSMALLHNPGGEVTGTIGIIRGLGEANRLGT